MKIRRIRDKIVLHPIMTLCILILLTIIASGILTLFNVSANYNKVSNSGTYVRELVKVENLFSLSGVKFIFSNAVSNFASFTPLSMLIITLIGIGIMDRSGFLDSFFYVLTKRASKRTVTFILSLICILASIGGDLSYIVLIPLAALLFKYGKRHPKAGIICAFASLSCGIGINVLMNSIDSSLLGYTILSANLLSPDYQIGTFAYILIMLVAAVALALIITSVTEKNIVPRLGHYSLLDEEEDYFTKTERRALVISLGAGLIYLLIFIYNIIPNAPLGGNLLDYSQSLYIDKLFGYNSFFNQGFVFVVTLLFFILGLTYGIVNKSIKNHHDVFEYLSYSLDYIGKVLVLIFFASALIFIFKKTNIGSVITASFANLISNSGFTGVPLVILTFIISSICTLVLPNSVSKWAILSGSVIPTFMNAGITPEFATVAFRAGECITYGLTPIMAYFVIYLAFMELYSTNDHEGLWGNMKYLLPYAGYTFLMWFVLLTGWYLIGLPLGIGGHVGL
jgi:aminobenzoyl-glutamate transport protein